MRELALVASSLLLAAAAQPCRADVPPPPPGMVLGPGGEYGVGGDGDQDYSPAHTVTLPPFYIDEAEVTNAQYLEFCEAAGHRLPEFWGMDVYRSGPGFPDHPVVGVSWWDAAAYARWRGVRLPTEAEWEVAARGGLEGRTYSHGDDLDPEVYGTTGVTGSAGPVTVRSFPPNGYGLYEMNGNVSEWVADRYDATYYARSPRFDPPGASTGVCRVVRGGGWHTGPGCFPVFYRTPLKSNWVDFNVGFRCALSAGESAAHRLETVLARDGLAEALADFWAMLRAEPGSFAFSEPELTDLGLRLRTEGRTHLAVEVLRLVTVLRPASHHAHRSLGEALAELGNRSQAIAALERALELSPSSGSTRALLDELIASR